MTDRDRPRDDSLLTGAWALGAVSDQERREFEEYLAEPGADAVRAEATELADTAVYLGLAAAPEQPPAEMKSRLMDLIESTPQQVVAEPTAEAGAATAGHRPAHGRARSRWFTRPATVLAAAAAAAALIVGGTVVARSVVAEQQLAAAVAEIADAPDARSATAEIATGGTATLYWSESLQRSALRMEGLQDLPDDKAYEFWYIDAAGRATPAGLLQESGDQRLVLDGDLEPGATVGISVEPESGSDAPTTEPILAIPTS